MEIKNLDAKDFKKLINQKNKIDLDIARKQEKIEQIRKLTQKRVKKLKYARKAAIDQINNEYDERIALLKQEAKKKLFLLKDQKEFSSDRQEEIDDMICSAFQTDDELAQEKNETVQESIDSNPVSELRIAMSNFRFKVKFEQSFKVEFLKLKKLLLDQPSKEYMNHLIQIEELVFRNSKARVIREDILQKLNAIEEML